MDEHEFFFPGRQALYEYDHSSGHLKKDERALCTGKMGVRYGGTGKIAPRDTPLTQFCVGDSRAILYQNPQITDEWSKTAKDGWVEKDFTLAAGAMMSFTHTVEGPTPHYNLTAPKYDKVNDVVDKKTGAVKKVTEPGYVGKPIGKSQAVWLRGLWVLPHTQILYSHLITLNTRSTLTASRCMV